MPRVEHPDLPRCADCGNQRGPWSPTGELDQHGAQMFRCALGHGCQDRDAIAERAAQRRAREEIARARAEFDGSDEVPR